MKTTTIIYALVALLLIFQSCKRNETLKSSTDDVNKPSKLGPSSAPSAYGTFQLSNVYSSQVMEIRNDSNLLKPQTTPANLQQNANGNTGAGVAEHQKWYFIQQGTGAITSSTAFKIMNA